MEMKRRGKPISGKKRHRTFSMKGIRPDASEEAIDAILRALAPILIYPITQVRKVTKRKIFFIEDAAPSAPATCLRPAEVVLPVPLPVEPEIIPVEPDLMPEPEMPVWEWEEEEEGAGERERFALALLFMYLLWAWNLSSQGRAPPMLNNSPRPAFP